ncbi:MAG: carboxypeptidase-like regulatory domain-containing protein [Bacteroidales bacterium]|nr:carboxypeptidase-like regulatory domain-containing protein [Bacteroidales bacterium]
MKLKLILLSLLVCFSAMAQNDPQVLRFSVSGTVVDSEDGHALQYVNITVPGQQYATVTNSDGGFIIKTSEEPEWLDFNLLGYKTSRIPYPGNGSDVEVKMEKNKLTLNEAIVVSGDPYKIIDEAIRKIRNNYSNQPELFECFYRETIQKRHRYIYISEAVARMIKTSYAREPIFGDRITIDKSRVLVSPEKKDTLSVKVAGGPAQAVDLDIVKNNELLTVKELSNYTLKMETPAMIGDRIQFAIRLIPTVIQPYPLYEGMIYIDRETLAFTRFDLNYDMRDKDKVTRLILVSKPAGLRFTPTEVTLRYDYTTSGGITRVSYVRTSMRFKCDWKKKLLRTDFTAVSELVTTDRKSGEIDVIPRKESFGSRDALSDKAKIDFDPEFWKEYNIIEPTESLDKAIGRIKRQTDRN